MSALGAASTHAFDQARFSEDRHDTGPRILIRR